MSITVHINNEQESVPVPDRFTALIRTAIAQTATMERVQAGEVSVTLVDDARIHALNEAYRQVDRPTDVLSFPQGDDFPLPEESGVAPLLGDIVISLPRAKEQAESYGHSLERELAFLTTHGFLHLLGYDHQTEAEEKQMFRRQEDVLAAIGLTR